VWIEGAYQFDIARLALFSMVIGTAIGELDMAMVNRVEVMVHKSSFGNNAFVNSGWHTAIENPENASVPEKCVLNLSQIEWAQESQTACSCGMLAGQETLTSACAVHMAHFIQIPRNIKSCSSRLAAYGKDKQVFQFLDPSWKA
jgi:hypothetical protein